MRVDTLVDRGLTPGLGTILVGDDPTAPRTCEARTAEAYGGIGIVFAPPPTPPPTSRQRMLGPNWFNEDPAVDGFIVQLPLPGDLDEEAAAPRSIPSKGRRTPPGEPRAAEGVDAQAGRAPRGIQALLVHHQVPIAREARRDRGPWLAISYRSRYSSR